jgi:hypothetical protein
VDADVILRAFWLGYTVSLIVVAVGWALAHHLHPRGG